MGYIKLSITTNPAQAEALSEALTKLGALSISLQDAEDEPIFQVKPGESPLWQHTKLDALFEKEIAIETIIKALKSKNSDIMDLDFYTEKIEDQDWVKLTQQHFHPKQYGNNLWVCPAWENADDLPGTLVKIDPGLAFGTGTHPTTDLCLTWLANNPPKDKTVIDYGCGSGILSLAALALGAKKVYAIDHDQQALIATENNAKLNDFYLSKQLTISLSEEHMDLKADIILANILANPLIELAPKIIKSLNPGGTLILSGLLDEEIDRVASAYEQGLHRIEAQVQEGWARLVFSI